MCNSVVIKPRTFMIADWYLFRGSREFDVRRWEWEVEVGEVGGGSGRCAALLRSALSLKTQKLKRPSSFIKSVLFSKRPITGKLRSDRTGSEHTVS